MYAGVERSGTSSRLTTLEVVHVVRAGCAVCSLVHFLMSLVSSGLGFVSRSLVSLHEFWNKTFKFNTIGDSIPKGSKIDAVKRSSVLLVTISLVFVQSECQTGAHLFLYPIIFQGPLLLFLLPALLHFLSP